MSDGGFQPVEDVVDRPLIEFQLGRGRGFCRLDGVAELEIAMIFIEPFEMGIWTVSLLLAIRRDLGGAAGRPFLPG
jgi:hypothetical protein